MRLNLSLSLYKVGRYGVFLVKKYEKMPFSGEENYIYLSEKLT